MKFQFLGGWNETLTYIIGWLCFLATLKFIKLLRFNKRMDMLGSTLRASGKNISMFSEYKISSDIFTRVEVVMQPSHLALYI